MSGWRDIAERLGEGSRPPANSAISADSGSEARVSAPIGPNDTNGTAPLSASFVAGLKQLRGMAAPSLKRHEVWREIVDDALRLASEGWAQKALALGWEPLHLWGVSPAAGGIVDLEGLAVWLAGRRVVLLDERSCVVANGPRSHAQFNVRSMDGAVFLWDLGRWNHG